MRHTRDLRADYTPTSGLGRTFDNLHIRPKLIVLHNLFFFLLGVSVYFAVIPPFERRVATAKTIEISLITEILATDRPLLRLPKIASYDYREGTLEQINEALAAIDLPPLNRTKGSNPTALPAAPVSIIWSPLPGGSPRVKGHFPGNYCPGTRWVDWVIR